MPARTTPRKLHRRLAHESRGDMVRAVVVSVACAGLVGLACSLYAKDALRGGLGETIQSAVRAVDEVGLLPAEVSIGGGCGVMALVGYWCFRLRRRDDVSS